MHIPSSITRMLLAAALLANILMPASAGALSHTISSMDDMGHSKTDIISCLNQHQAPTAPVTKETKDIDGEDDIDPTPPETPTLRLDTINYSEPGFADNDITTSSSFKPPDIVIETANLRI